MFRSSSDLKITRNENNKIRQTLFALYLIWARPNGRNKYAIPILPENVFSNLKQFNSLQSVCSPISSYNCIILLFKHLYPWLQFVGRIQNIILKI